MKKNILILRGDKPDKISEAYRTFEGLRQTASDNYKIGKYRDLAISINNKKVLVSLDDTDISDYDLVYIRDFGGYEFERNAVALYLKISNTKFLNSDVINFQHISKLTQYIVFANNDIPIPATLYSNHDYLIKTSEKVFGYPYILKSISGNSGRDNYLINTRHEAEDIVSKFAEVKFLAQEFIPNDGDFRLIVLGDKIPTIYSRKSKKGDHRNNITQGGKKAYIEVNELKSTYHELAIKAANLLSREISGVDLMIDNRTNNPYILEANFNFGIAADKVEGTPDEVIALAEYLHQKA